MSLLVQLFRDWRGPRARAAPGPRPAAPGAGADLYIDLLKRCVGNSIYDDDLDLSQGTMVVDPASGKYSAVEAPPADAGKKYLGDIWPSRAHTMIGIPRLDNLQFCVETVLKDGVPGDLIETGV